MWRKSGTLHEDQCTFMVIPSWILLRMRNVVDKTCAGNQNKHFMFNDSKAPPPLWISCLLWDNLEKYSRAEQATDDNTKRRFPFAFWITKAIRFDHRTHPMHTQEQWTAPISPSVAAVFFLTHFSLPLFPPLLLVILFVSTWLQVPIQWNWLQEQFCNLSLYTLYLLSV